MSQEDIALDEKRVYAETRDVTVVYVGSTPGLARVTVSGDQTGRMSLVYSGAVTDVAGDQGSLLVATDDDVLIGTGDGFEQTGFGPAVAVGVGADLLLAASPDGEVARLSGDEWVSLGNVEEPRRFDGPYLATAEGVVRADPDADTLERLGLGDVWDVAGAGPYAATDEGLQRLTDSGEWITDREDGCSVVAAREDGPDGRGRAHVVTADGGLFERAGEEWVPCDQSVEAPVADVAYGEATYAVTGDGTFLVDADPETTPDGERGWRRRSLGLPGVTAVAVP